MPRQKWLLSAVLTTVSATGVALQGQQIPAATSKLDVSVTYIAQRGLSAGAGQSFWSQGGSIEVGTNVSRGFGVAADVTGTHSSSIGTSGVPLSLVTVTFGPRYRWHPDRKISVFGQALVGEADGFHSLFPARLATQSNANGLALQIGGAVDYRLGPRFAMRLLDAAWVRTQLPNSTDNVQNNLRLGAGVVVRLGR